MVITLHLNARTPRISFGPRSNYLALLDGIEPFSYCVVNSCLSARARIFQHIVSAEKSSGSDSFHLT
jgi:hypothetical protein